MIRFSSPAGHEDHGQATGPVPTAVSIHFLPLLLAVCLFVCPPILGVGPVSAEEPVSVPVKILVAYHSLSGNTERMAEAVVEGAKSIPGAVIVMKRVGQVTADDLFSSDAVIVGSPVYWSNMSGEVKTFFDNWQFKFGVFPDFKMKNKVGAAFATGGQISSGKEVTMLTILAAMLGNQMIVVSGGGAFGASATTEGDSPGVDNIELADARALGQRVAEVAVRFKSGSAQ
ncbi:MAG: NAD(P)H-dependent oxidoreductase [Nitrospiraceae bacterium]|nr:NAD(P)H-dependent oxidoreductase [Nitrospiraceae bacterium]